MHYGQGNIKVQTKKNVHSNSLPAAAAAASAKSVFRLFSASKVFIVRGIGPRWPVKVEVEEALELWPVSSWSPFFFIPFPFWWRIGRELLLGVPAN